MVADGLLSRIFRSAPFYTHQFHGEPKERENLKQKGDSWGETSKELKRQIFLGSSYGIQLQSVLESWDRKCMK